MTAIRRRVTLEPMSNDFSGDAMSKRAISALGGTSLLLTAFLVGLAAAHPAEPSAEGVEFFEKKVRPVLAEHCFRCHSGDKDKGGLRLDSHAALLKGGDNGPALVAGQPEKSLLVKVVGYKDDLRMPPKKKLPDAAIANLTAWVKMGAPWPADTAIKTGPANAFDLKARMKHWCWQPVKEVEPPAVRDKTWPLSKIDHFLLAKLEENGMKPAPAADKRTLLRRATYDLIGLPPTPAEIERYLADETPTAFATVIDRLLASPHYGERWGRHWLDLTRFAETYGHEFDPEILDAYAYRDYVIRAFNADVPYDQLVTEHIAGDLLPEPRRHPTERFDESILGTGFWFLGEAKHSPVDVRVDEAERIDNQIDVFSKAFLALTVSCARCHDHKFDAITTKDYHALMGYALSSRQQRASLSVPDRKDLPEIRGEVEPLALAHSANTLRIRVEKLSAHLLSKPVAPKRPDPLLAFWFPLTKDDPTPEAFDERRRQLVRQWRTQAERAAEGEKQNTVFADFTRPGFRDWFVTGEAFGDGPTTAPEVLLQADARNPVRAVVGANTAHSGRTADKLSGVLRSPSFTIAKKHIYYRVAGQKARVRLIVDGLQLIQDPIYGGLRFAPNHGDRPVWHGQDVSMWLGHRAYIEVIDDGAGFVGLEKVVFADGGPPPEPVNGVWLDLLDDNALTTPDRLARKIQQVLSQLVDDYRSASLSKAADRVALLNDLLQSEMLASLAAPPEPDDKLATLLERFKQVEAKLPATRHALAIADGTGWDGHVYIRGNPATPGERVPRRNLEALDGPDQPVPTSGSGRLELARRLVKPSNPLMARVMVNRLWHHHFGAGLVRSVDNFGVLGETPSHPELLDHLAAEFVRQGWSIKKMHRTMMLSRAYQMSSKADDARAEERDPQNKLLHRMPLRRLEAEAIRDGILAVSGRLDRTRHGPGVMPHLTPYMNGRGRPGTSGPLDGDGRRSIYINVRRNFITPFFLAFDYPIPFTTMGKRGASNVPAQALALMNNPLVVQQAELWAKRVLAEPNRPPRQRIAGMYETAFGRPPSETELTDSLTFLEEQAKTYGKTDDPRAWADLCHVLFNVKEFIFLN